MLKCLIFIKVGHFNFVSSLPINYLCKQLHKSMKFFFSFLLILLNIELFSQYPESQYIDIAGVRIHYRQWKPTTPAKGQMLLIHGFCGSTFTWRNNVAAFVNEGYEVSAIDLPPFGYSEKKRHLNHSTSFNAALAWKIAQKIGDSTQKWVLVGHSMGGDICKYMFFLNPQKVKSIVFSDPAFSIFYQPSWFRRKVFGSAIAYQVGEKMGKYYFFKYKRIKKLLKMAYSQEGDSAAVAGYLDNLNQKGLAGGIIEMSASGQVFNFDNQHVSVLCLQIWGDKDQVVSFTETKPYLKCLPPDTPIEFIKDGGHCPMETHPLEFNALILSFLKKNELP